MRAQTPDLRKIALLIMNLLGVGLFGLVSAFAAPDQLGEPLQTEKYTSEAIPGYEINAVNPSSLGLDNVRQEAGYLSTPLGDRIFYWLFESRGTPRKDPLVVWLNGGPGCSSLEAVLFENGPVNIDTQNKLSHNSWSWNNNANLLYIDNPSGVGYSVGGNTVTDTVTASEDFKNAMSLFFEKHPQYSKNGFHLAGESYAGRYIPVFAEAINTSPDTHANVSSVLIGNGLVNPIAEYASYQPFLCGEGGHAAVLSEQQCERLKSEIPACTNSMNTCMNTPGLQCQFAQFECNPFQRAFANKNPYDVRDAGCTPSKVGLCYPALDNVQQYFNDPTVRRALGADDGGSSQQYHLCNNRINAAFYANDDPFAPTFRNVTSLLEAGTPVLIYNGDADIVLNWLGARQWTSNLVWSGQSGFRAAGQEPVDWKPYANQKRGEITNFGIFTFLRVSDAGHMVPHDQPQSAFYMLDSWIKGDYRLRATFI